MTAWLARRAGDERMIRQRLDLLASALSGGTVRTATTPMVKRLAVLRDLFTDEITATVDAPVPEIAGIDSLMTFLAGALPSTGGMRVAFHDVSLEIDADRVTAHMTATATVTGSAERRRTTSTHASSRPRGRSRMAGGACGRWCR